MAARETFTPPTFPYLWGLWMLDLMAFLPIAVVYVLAGWIVGCLHRAHGALVVAFGWCCCWECSFRPP